MEVMKEPIAIVGMGCRAPGGVDSPEKFWELLSSEIDAISEIPAEREWDLERFYHEDAEKPGFSYTRHGGFIQGVYEFDPAFFSISSREVRTMDPQQRLALEVAWEALEHGGIRPSRIAGSNTGVFMGALSNDYMHLQFQRDAGLLEAHSVTGGMLSGISGRISYMFDLLGPSVTVDTACSSSLTAVHLACHALCSREIDCALAGGVNLMLIPEGTVMMCRIHALSRDGRCKTYDSSADGYGRSEGAGIIVLKRLQDAVRDNDNIFACIIGSVSNHNGKSAAFTVPNGRQQEAAIRKAIESAGINPGMVDYIEAHGTGTMLGDPIEMEAFARVFGEEGRRGRPLYVGSVKTNIGHAESAAGILGIIKTVLSFQKNKIPPNLHLKMPNGELPLDEVPVIIPARLTDFPQKAGCKIAGVSASGFSGTNVHIVLKGAGEPEKRTGHPEDKSGCPRLFTLSGKTCEAVWDRAKALKQYITDYPNTAIGDLCYTLGCGREHFEYRSSAVVETMEELTEILNLLGKEDRQSLKNLITRTEPGKPALAWLFTDSGCQFFDWRQDIYEHEPVFRKGMQQCDAFFLERTGESFLEAMHGQDRKNGYREKRLCVLYAASFAFRYAEALLWESLGIIPDAVAGAGSGIFAAAWEAGFYSMEDAFCLLIEYARLWEKLSERQRVYPFEVNRALEQFMQAFGSIPSNSPRMELIGGKGVCVTRKELGDCMADCMAGSFNELQTLHILRGKGYSVFMEIGAEAPLDSEKQRHRNASDAGTIYIKAFREGEEYKRTLLEGLSSLYSMGRSVDFDALNRPYALKRLALPTYPFRRKEYRLQTVVQGEPGREAARKRLNILGRYLPSPLKSRQYETVLTPAMFPEARDTGLLLHIGHYQEIITHAFLDTIPEADIRIMGLELLAALVLNEEFDVQIYCILTPLEDAVWEAEISSRSPGDKAREKEWTLHARCRVATVLKDIGLSNQCPYTRAACEKQELIMTGQDFYLSMKELLGLDFGQSVRWLEKLWATPDGVLAELRPATGQEALEAWPLGFPPGIIDSAAQVFNAYDSFSESESLFLLAGISGISRSNLPGGFPRMVRLHKKKTSSGDEKCGDVELLNEKGELLVFYKDVRLRRTSVKSFLKLCSRDFKVNKASQLAPLRLYHILRELPAEERRKRLAAEITGELERILGQERSAGGLDSAPFNLGIDSLMAMELQNWVKRNLGITPDISLILYGESVKYIVDRIDDQLESLRETPAGVYTASGVMEGVL